MRSPEGPYKLEFSDYRILAMSFFLLLQGCSNSTIDPSCLFCSTVLVFQAIFPACRFHVLHVFSSPYLCNCAMSLCWPLCSYASAVLENAIFDVKVL